MVGTAQQQRKVAGATLHVASRCVPSTGRVSVNLRCRCLAHWIALLPDAGNLDHEKQKRKEEKKKAKTKEKRKKRKARLVRK